MLEQEIKLTAAAEAVLDQVLASELVARFDTGKGGRDRTPYDGVYYDTADRDLLRRRCSLRVRKEGERWRCTMKFSGKVIDGVATRHELEIDIDGPIDNISMVPEGEIREKLTEQLPPDTPLYPRVSVNMQRSTRNLDIDGTRVELAVDNAVIRGDKGESRLYEVELELKQGSLDNMIWLSQKLLQAYPLTPSITTKYAIGLQLG